MQVITTHTTTLHLSTTTRTFVLGPDGKPASTSSTKLDLSISRTTIVVAQAEDVVSELGGQHTGLPVFGGKRGLVMPMLAEVVRLGLSGQRLVSAETRA